MNTPTTRTPTYFGEETDPLRPLCPHCAGHGYEPAPFPDVCDPLALVPCDSCDGTGHVPAVTGEDTLYTCRRCYSSWSAWDLRVQFTAHGTLELACPECSLREALEDAVDLDSIPGGPRSMLLPDVA